MWVEGGDIHDELLDRLGGVLAPPEDLALAPSAAELEALAVAVAARWPEGATAPVAVAATAVDDASGPDSGAVVHRVRWAGPRTRRFGSSAWRAGSVAAGIVVFSASAAAATGGVPLPRPVRVVAYTVGLPVDSPALDDTHQHIEDLKEAVKANDKPKAEATVRRLQTDLKKVPADEVKKAEPKVEKAIEEAVNKGVVTSPVPTTTTTVPPASSTTATTAPSSTTATTAEAKDDEPGKGKDKDKDKERSTVTATTAPSTTTTTAPDPTTTTTAPETDGTAPGGTTGEPGPGDGHTGAGDGTEPGTTPTTVPQDTTTTTGPPPEETTTTTTTTAPEPTTTTTTPAPSAP